MTRSRQVWMIGLMLVGLEGVAGAQTMVESALGAGVSAGASSSTRGVRPAIDGIGRSLDRVLKPGSVEAPGKSTVVRQKTSAKPQTEGEAPRATLAEAVLVTYEDPAAIRTGMACDEVIHRFGPPRLDVAGADIDRQLTYSSKTVVYQLDVRNGQVVRISPMRRGQTALVLPK